MGFLGAIAKFLDGGKARREFEHTAVSYLAEWAREYDMWTVARVKVLSASVVRAGTPLEQLLAKLRVEAADDPRLPEIFGVAQTPMGLPMVAGHAYLCILVNDGSWKVAGAVEDERSTVDDVARIKQAALDAIAARRTA